jgi:tRNA dimethylallyltransferase
VSSPEVAAIFIVGPTAVGKSRLAVSLARRFNGEIINADSRQVYSYMDIGTAKPGPVERSYVAHHLLDIQYPDHNYDLGSYLIRARSVIRDIRGRHRLPIVVGGTGQYIWALIEGWEIPAVPPDPDYRRTKHRIAEYEGILSLHRELEDIDPKRASELNPSNVRRVVRALEIYHFTGVRPSDYSKRTNQATEGFVIGLTMGRKELYRRIDARVDKMMFDGLLEETRWLASMGYRPGCGPMAAIGYREMGQYILGNITLAEAVQQTKFQTHRLVRRQYTWFKGDDPRIHWLDASGPSLGDQARALLAELFW